jgi:mono/diheme cytochrome c family protein
MRALRPTAVALLIAAAPCAAGAQEADLGRIEFMANCAQCHGTGGKGDGVIAGYLTVPPPDLTVIQRDNHGVFPEQALYAIIAGGGPTRAHGSREMPAWGARYSVDAYLSLGWPQDPEEREAFIRERIEALVGYVARLQVE